MGYEWIPVLKCLVICSDKGMKAAEAQLQCRLGQPLKAIEIFLKLDKIESACQIALKAQTGWSVILEHYKRDTDLLIYVLKQNQLLSVRTIANQLELALGVVKALLKARVQQLTMESKLTLFQSGVLELDNYGMLLSLNQVDLQGVPVHFYSREFMIRSLEKC